MSYVLIAVAASLLFIVNGLLGSMPGYRIAPVFLIPLLFAVYLLRARLTISPLDYGLFASALLLHDLGAYGFYQRSPTPPISFDMYVHTWFGGVGAILVYDVVRHHLPWRPWQVKLAALLGVMGIGAIHEIMEFSTYLVLGEERGMLKPTTSYRFDNERDLTCNLAGALVALLLTTLFERFTRPVHRRDAETAEKENWAHESARSSHE